MKTPINHRLLERSRGSFLAVVLLGALAHPFLACPAQSETNRIQTNTTQAASATAGRSESHKLLTTNAIQEFPDVTTNAVKWYRKAAEQGNADAQYALGVCYENGQVVARDKVEAVNWLTRAAEGGDPDAQRDLANIYQSGEGVATNMTEAVKWFRKAAEQNDADAQHNLGKCYANGQGVAQDYAEAVKWYRKAAKQNNAFAQCELGHCCIEGRGVPTNNVEAYKWFDLADFNNLGADDEAAAMLEKLASVLPPWEIEQAEQMTAEALSGIPEETKRRNAWYIDLAADTKFEQKDWVAAARLARKAARFGNVDAMSLLGWIYSGGLPGVPKDLPEAVRFYRAAVTLGDSEAQFNLATMLEDGEGTSQDYEEALKLYEQVMDSKAGLAIVAETHVALMYRDGRGVIKNVQKAIKLLSDAAEHGWFEAQYELGKMYLNGDGVPQSYMHAYVWLNLAGAQNTAARSTRDSLAKLMSPDEIAEAQRRSAAFVAKEGAGSSAEARSRRAANVEDSTLKASGSGFFVTEDGYLVTCYHVVENANRIVLRTKHGDFQVKLVNADKANDLAVLKAVGKFPPLPIAPSRGVKLGETVLTVGFPNTGLQGFAPKLTKGEISSLAGAQDDPRHFQISVAVQPGNSGGPLVNQAGSVIGIVEARLSDMATFKATGSLPQNVNYAVKSSLLSVLLESLPEVSAKLKEPSPVKDRKFEDVVKETESATALVLVY